VMGTDRGGDFGRAAKVLTKDEARRIAIINQHRGVGLRYGP
jgi:hypothetical protein